MKAYIKSSVNGIWAGIMIAIGSLAYLNCPNKTVGAFLFSIGLISIMSFGFNLYTGAVGYARHIKDIPLLLNTVLMNGIGCGLTALVPTSGAEVLIASKLECSPLAVFFKAIVCGILIFVCVAHKKDIRVTILAIPAFILIGAEHSIADIAFLFAAKHFSLKAAIFLFIVILGNAVGALAISFWLDVKAKWDKEPPEKNT